MTKISYKKNPKPLQHYSRGPYCTGADGKMQEALDMHWIHGEQSISIICRAVWGDVKNKNTLNRYIYGKDTQYVALVFFNV